MNYNKSVAVLVLYSHVVGLAKASSKLKKQIKRAKKIVEDKPNWRYRSVNLNTDKYELRREIRYSQLAYGFIRGRSYKQIESQCSPDNIPSSLRITEILKSLLYPYDFEKIVGSESQIKKWLAGDK